MAFLYHDGTSLTRLYYGTDTHAQSLLVGAAAAVALALMRSEHDCGLVPLAHSRRLTIALGGIGVIGFLSLGGMVHLLGGSSSFTYQGAFLVTGLSAAAVISSVVVSGSGPVAQLLELGPLRYIGRISYGVYLWHFPLFIWIDHQRTGLNGYALFAVRIVTTLIVSSISYRLVELPIMRGAAFGKKIGGLQVLGLPGPSRSPRSCSPEQPRPQWCRQRCRPPERRTPPTLGEHAC